MTLEEFRTLKTGDEIIMRYPTSRARDNFMSDEYVPTSKSVLIDTLIVNQFPVKIDRILLSFKENPIFSICDLSEMSFSWKWADRIVYKNNEILELATDEEFMSLFK